MDSKIVHEHSGWVAVPEKRTEANVAKKFCGEASMEEQNKHETIGAVKLITVLAEMESSLVVARLTVVLWL